MLRALYPGTFDPITLGHLNILEKALKLFDDVVLAVADYTGKHTMFSLEERVRMCTEATQQMKGVRVIGFSGLVVDLARKQQCGTMIRGMRAVSDFEYELSLALTNKKLNPEIETIFLVPSLKYLYLSSSMIRQLAELGAPLGDFLPPVVAKYLSNKFGHHS